jgi:hypothetical protein
MSKEDDDDPTIEVRELLPSERIELEPLSDVKIRESSGWDIFDAALLFDNVPPEIQAHILAILRAVSRHPRGVQLELEAPDSESTPGGGGAAGET